MTILTTVVNIHHRMPYDVYIGRPGQGLLDTGWKNDFRISETLTREDAVRLHEEVLLRSFDPRAVWMRANLHTLKGMRLGCFCHPAVCHGHTYAKYANALAPGQALPLNGLPGVPRFAPAAQTTKALSSGDAPKEKDAGQLDLFAAPTPRRVP